MDDREIKMLAAKVVEADPKALGEAIDEVLMAKKTAEIGVHDNGTSDFWIQMEKSGLNIKPNFGIGKFLKISDDLELHRYRGADFVKLIGRRPAKGGCKPKCYEIVVSKDMIKNRAVCYIDDEECFEIVQCDCSTCDLEMMAVSALKRLVKRRKQANARRHRSRKRKQIEKLALKGVSE